MTDDTTTEAAANECSEYIHYCNCKVCRSRRDDSGKACSGCRFHHCKEAILRTSHAALLTALKEAISKLPNKRMDISGVGWCAGCGAVLWVAGDDSPPERCKPGCALVAARDAIAAGEEVANG